MIGTRIRAVYQEISVKPCSVDMDLGWAQVSLLPSAPYSIRHESHRHVLGFAFERQRGVHSIGSDLRSDFDAWPGDLAFTQADVEIFSESAHGGEYLTLHVGDVPLDARSVGRLDVPRAVFHGNRRVVQLGCHLRRLMLDPQLQLHRVEECAVALLEHGLTLLALPPRERRYDLDRSSHVRVLEYIEDSIGNSLRLEELARIAHMPVLHFLRSFASATGSTPHAYVNDRRLQRARVLLRSTEQSIATIAAECGFAHQSHLGAALKKQLGLSPRQCRALALPEIAQPNLASAKRPSA